MKNISFATIGKILFVALILQGCSQSPAAQPVEPPTIAPTTVTVIQPTQTPLTTSTLTVTPPPTQTSTTAPTETPTITPTATTTPTFQEKMAHNIVFYLILPEKGRTDACGAITVEPIISKRLRTGDKIQDVQIALNMLFNVGAKHFGVYYNALWDTSLQVNTVKYDGL
jgi:PBP1b-binding outer membrane lipoprotein LpoB